MTDGLVARNMMMRHLVKSSLRASQWQRGFSSRSLPKGGPSFADFLKENPGSPSVPHEATTFADPYVSAEERQPQPDRKFYIETYGCQMNISDSEIVHSVLAESGMSQTDVMEDANVILVNTCAIRDNAESKVWQRLGYFKNYKRKRQLARLSQPLVGVLGCMAERLKTKLVESDKMVDVVAGPDSYRDLPRLLSVAESVTAFSAPRAHVA